VARSGPEVADVFRRYGEAYRERHGASLCTAQRRVMSAIELCRTAALGGHIEQCDRCDHQRICYNSCRDRHCPKCQSLARTQWLDDRRSELLDTQYFHVIFTVPQPIATIALQNKDVVYNILFRATSETLRTIAADPKHLGAQIGFFRGAPHMGTGSSPPPPPALRPSRWGHFTGRHAVDFLPAELRPSRSCVEASVPSTVPQLSGAGLRFRRVAVFFLPGATSQRHAFLRHIAPTRKINWKVYAKPPFGGPEQVLKYVARYTHRVAISNDRLLGLDDGKVQFRWKDYRDNSRHKTMTLAAEEFIRRFLLHVLPERFQRIRYYGFLANRYRAEKLALCRQLLQIPLPAPKIEIKKDYRDRYEEITGVSLKTCPLCRHGTMIVVETFECAANRAPRMDTS
jgi:Putative transposase/Transposase zinc-binding domain